MSCYFILPHETLHHHRQFLLHLRPEKTPKGLKSQWHLVVKIQVLLSYLSFLPPLDNASLSNGERKTLPFGSAAQTKPEGPLTLFCASKLTTLISFVWRVYTTLKSCQILVLWSIWGDLVDNKSPPKAGFCYL